MCKFVFGVLVLLIVLIFGVCFMVLIYECFVVLVVDSWSGVVVQCQGVVIDMLDWKSFIVDVELCCLVDVVLDNNCLLCQIFLDIEVVCVQY